MPMLKIENHIGTIGISHEYLIKLIGYTVTNCFGVVKMNSSGAKQDLLSLLKIRKATEIDRGVLIRYRKDGSINIDLHITVRYGTNINAISESIKHKVQYAIENDTSLKVNEINVFIDGMES